MDPDLNLPIWSDVLVAMAGLGAEDSYCEKLNKKVKTTRSHMSRIVKKLESNALVVSCRGKKIKIASVTAEITVVTRLIWSRFSTNDTTV